MSDSSDEDDDMTLADLMASSKKKSISSSSKGTSKSLVKKKSDAVAEEDSSSSSSDDDGMTLADMMKNAKKKKKKEEEESSSSSDDSDDGISLADLRKKMQKKKRARSSSGTKKKKKKQKTKAATAPAGGQRRIVQTNGALLKPQLVESVLVRWNYCKKFNNWPLLKDGLEKVPSKSGFIELRGFPGVLVGIREPHVGKIIDYRDKSKAPCFNNLIRFESEELKKLAEEAIQAQIEILEAQDVDHSKLLKNLRAEMKDIKRVSSNKSDKQWTKLGWKI